MLNRRLFAHRLAILCPLVLALITQGCTTSDSGDYLTPELRQRVEALKLEAPESTEDIAVLSDRLDTLWQWANAYSLTGGPVPDVFPQLLANANRSLRGLGGGATIPVPRVSEFIRLYTVAPSIVAPGEPFTLAVRAEDRLKNLSSGVMPALEVLLDGEPVRTIEAGSPAISLLEDVSLAEAGVYRFSVRNEDGSIRATSNPVRVEEAPLTVSTGAKLTATPPSPKARARLTATTGSAATWPGSTS